MPCVCMYVAMPLCCIRVRLWGEQKKLGVGATLSTAASLVQAKAACDADTNCTVRDDGVLGTRYTLVLW